MTVALLDFEDSFTYNIAAEIIQCGVPCEVIKYSESLAFLKKIPANVKILAWGPGPGHPGHYLKHLKLLQKLLKNDAIKHIGFCLGHQMIWAAAGAEIIRSQHPCHGQKVPLKLPHEWNHIYSQTTLNKTIYVQRYNSLVVSGDELFLKGLTLLKKTQLCFSSEGELMMSCFEQGMTFQFHPESVGTSCPKRLIAPCVNSLYN